MAVFCRGTEIWGRRGRRGSGDASQHMPVIRAREIASIMTAGEELDKAKREGPSSLSILT